MEFTNLGDLFSEVCMYSTNGSTLVSRIELSALADEIQVNTRFESSQKFKYDIAPNLCKSQNIVLVLTFFPRVSKPTFFPTQNLLYIKETFYKTFLVITIGLY